MLCRTSNKMMMTACFFSSIAGFKKWFSCFVFFLVLASGFARLESLQKEAENLNFNSAHPKLACTPVELARLRGVLRQGSSLAVQARIKRADSALAHPFDFPARGGRHNQWYQCDKCQTALTVTSEGAHQCPLCKRNYSGKKYAEAALKSLHSLNLRAMLDCAWAYALTDDLRYAELSLSLLLGYAERYLNYPRKGTSAFNLPYNYVTGARLYDQTLSEAHALVVYIAPAYDLIYHAPTLGDFEHSEIQKKLLLPILLNIKKSWWNGGDSNWQAWHNAAMFWGGTLLGSQDLVRHSLFAPKSGFFFQLSRVSANGFWHEGSWGYHFYALQALTWQAEGARRLGIDLWSEPSFQAMFVLPAAYLMPDGCLPRWGDDTGVNPKRHAALYEAAWYNLNKFHGFGAIDNSCKAAIASFLPEQPLWETMLYGRSMPVMDNSVSPINSKALPQSGHVILRRKSEAGLTVASTFAPHGGYHSHLDKLSFVFYGFGEELGVDPGRAASQAYRLPLHKKWYRATISHNAVLMNGLSQQPSAGQLEDFKETEDYSLALLRAAPWRGVRQRRLFFLTDEYLVVLDDIRTRRKAAFDWLYHQKADSVSCDAPLKPAQPLRSLRGGEYIHNQLLGETDQPLTAFFKAEKTELKLYLAGGEDTQIMTGDGPGRSVTERIPLILARREGRSVWFAAVFTPLPIGGVFQETSMEIERMENQDLQMRLQVGTTTKTIYLRNAGVEILSQLQQ